MNIWNLVKKITRGSIATVSILIIIYGVFFLTTTMVNGGDRNRGNMFGYTVAVGTGESMLPTFNENFSLLISENIDTDEIKVGDIIRFKSYYKEGTENKVDHVVHRVIKIDKHGNFITKGDGNDYVDETIINPKFVYGKITHVFQDGKLVNVDSLTPEFVLNYLEDNTLVF